MKNPTFPEAHQRLEHLLQIRELLDSLISEEEDERYRLLDRINFLIGDMKDAFEQGDF